jgi:hypothetical protein
MPGLHKGLAFLAALVLAACGGAQQYAGPQEKNLAVRTAAVGVSVVMGVHRLDEKCFARYEGTVTLDRPTIEVGLPTGRLSLLVFEFYSLSVFSGNRSLRREAKIAPRPGYRYEALVTYKDSLYNVELREIDPRSGTARELDVRRGC